MDKQELLEEHLTPKLKELHKEGNKIPFLYLMYYFILFLSPAIYPLGVFFNFWSFNVVLYAVIVVGFLVSEIIRLQFSSAIEANETLSLTQTKLLLTTTTDDKKEEKLKLHMLKSWVRGAVLEQEKLEEALSAIYKEYEYDEVAIEENAPTNTYIKFIHLQDRIKELKDYYQEKIGGSYMGLSSIEETLAEIDDAIENLAE